MSKQFHKTGSSVSERDTKEKKGARTCLLEKQKKKKEEKMVHSTMFVNCYFCVSDPLCYCFH